MKLRQLLIASAAILGLFSSANAQKFNPNTMTPEQLISMERIGSSSLSPDGKTIVYAASFPSIPNNNISSRLFTISINGKNQKQITPTNQNAYAPTWIDNGKKIAYMSTASGSMQLYVMNPDGTDVTQVTDMPKGISGFIFSPNGEKVLLIRDVKYSNLGKDKYKDLPKTTGRIITNLMYRHWDEWVESIPHIFYASYTQGKIIKDAKDILEGEPYEAPMKPFAGIEDIAWSPDSKCIAYASRKKTGKAYTLSTNSDIYIYDTTTGKTKNISKGMMGYDTYPKFSPNGKYIAWISMEHDGYESDLKRLFVMDLATGERAYVDKAFDCNVNAIQWKRDNKSIYFLSCIKAESQLLRIDLQEKDGMLNLHKQGDIHQLTTGQYNYVSFDVQNGVMIAERQSMQVPTDIYRIDIKTGKATQLTYSNKALLSKLAPITVEKRWMKTTDGGNMLVWVILPPHFDKKKKYPALLYCQGGPQDAISQFFSYRWNFRIMAEHGYVVIAPNRHGVPSFGQAWNAQISGDYPGQNMRDYLTAIDEMKKEPWIDANHLGCVGASYGGFSVYYLAGHHNHRFKAFVAHDGIFNMPMQYMTTDEMWFANWDMGGAPWDKNNKIAQRTFANSPDKFIDKWDTPILVIHNEKDFRIDIGQGLAAFNAAQLRGIPSELLVFPDENHWVLKPQNAVLWQRTFFSWLDRWLKPHHSRE